MGKFLILILFILFSFGANGQVPSIKGQDDTTKMYPVNYEVPGKKAIKLNSTTVLLDTDQDNLLVNGGDIFALGKHRLLCGDSTLPGDWERLMSGEEAVLVVTDPPYNMGYEGAGRTPKAKIS